jgi:hypothetical protein
MGRALGASAAASFDSTKASDLLNGGGQRGRTFGRKQDRPVPPTQFEEMRHHTDSSNQPAVKNEGRYGISKIRFLIRVLRSSLCSGRRSASIGLVSSTHRSGDCRPPNRVRGRRRVIVAWTAIALAFGAPATTVLAANYGTTLRVGNLVVRFRGAINPKALPKNRMAPISFHGSASIATDDGSHVPPVLSTHLQVDKHIQIDTTGLPSCTYGKIAASTPAQAMSACGSALIGKGSTTVQVAFPEQAPFTATGPVLAFNGPSIGSYGDQGYPEQLYYTYVSVPVSTAVVVVAKLSKDCGKYGYRISIRVPKIAGGSGSVTHVEFTIGRKWTFGGQEHSYLNGECPSGRFLNQIEVAYGDGTNLHGSLVNSCQSKG